LKFCLKLVVAYLVDWAVDYFDFEAVCLALLPLGESLGWELWVAADVLVVVAGLLGLLSCL
jgi:hypothetical protein